MVISNLNIKLIEDRLGFINKAVAKLKKTANLSEDDFFSRDATAVAESYISRSLEAMFDIGDILLQRPLERVLLNIRR